MTPVLRERVLWANDGNVRAIDNVANEHNNNNMQSEPVESVL
jgi:hypothetical protein